jgi:hypothetical protein
MRSFNSGRGIRQAMACRIRDDWKFAKSIEAVDRSQSKAILALCADYICRVFIECRFACSWAGQRLEPPRDVCLF